MPRIYLSPSTQESNLYVDGSGSEEYFMNLIADSLEPYLVSNAIDFTRNTSDMTASSSIAASNAGNYDLHLALHSNAAPGERSGLARGSDIFYYPTSKEGKRFADIAAQNLQVIYPNPELVKTVASSSLGEIRQTKAPAVLMELAFHDNPEDAQWIQDNIDLIARNIALSLTEYFGIPFAEPMSPQEGTIVLRFGNLNIRSKPSIFSSVVGTGKNGDLVIVLGQVGDWYVIRHNGVEGYVKTNFIEV